MIKINKKIDKQKGITLIALAITMVLILLIAGVTLNTALGDEGIIGKVKDTIERHKKVDLAEEDKEKELEGLLEGNLNELENGDNIFGDDESDKLKKQLEELQGTVDNLEEQLAKEKENKTKLENQVNDLNTQIDTLEEDNQNKSGEIENLQGKLEAKTEELNQQNETVNSLQTTVDSLKKQVETLNGQVSSLNNQVKTLTAKQATGNAGVGDVLSGKTFSNSSGVNLNGSMVNKGTWTTTINPGVSVTVPAGYHNGSGKVTANKASRKCNSNTGISREDFFKCDITKFNRNNERL